MIEFLVVIAYIVASYFVYDFHKEEEVDVFEDTTWLRIAFFFGMMVILFFSLLAQKIFGWDEDNE